MMARAADRRRHPGRYFVRLAPTRPGTLPRLLLGVALLTSGCGRASLSAVDQRVADETLARFPKEVLGAPFPTEAFYGDKLGDYQGQIDDLARSLGVSPDRVLFIVGGNPDIGIEKVTATAYRVLGVDGTKTKEYFLPLLQTPSGSPLPVRQLDIGGKHVETIGGEGSDEATVDQPMIYIRDDTVYLISGDAKPVEALLGALP